MGQGRVWLHFLSADQRQLWRDPLLRWILLLIPALLLALRWLVPWADNALAPLFAWFVPEPWQFLFGIIPTYWIAKAYWVWPDSLFAAFGYGALALIYQGVLVRVFYRRMNG